MSFSLRFLILLTFAISNGYGQEICDNGIDDDLDGLIDGFDTTDCPCGTEIFNLPNPSFEDKTCCPNSFSRMHCTDNWTQASAATSDYYDICGYRTITANYPATPPDGAAYVGFLNGVVQQGNRYPNLKEYIGTCLPDTLKKGTTYTFSFWILHALGNAITTISLYGSTTCSNLPFGRSGGLFFGCPSNDSNWSLLGETTLRTYTNNWTQHSFSFTPNQDILTIVFGPDCTPATGHNYYYMDGLEIRKEYKCNSLLTMPNVFTPNGDGINDVFKPVIMSNIKKTKLLVYNRWGQQIFETENIKKGWDGKTSGESVSDGTYFWIVTYTDINDEELIKKGNLSIFT